MRRSFEAALNRVNTVFLSLTKEISRRHIVRQVRHVAFNLVTVTLSKAPPLPSPFYRQQFVSVPGLNISFVYLPTYPEIKITKSVSVTPK